MHGFINLFIKPYGNDAILKTICSYSKSSKYTRIEYQCIDFEGHKTLTAF